MQTPGAIKHEIGKLSKATVDKIPLVVYIPAPPSDSSDPKADIHQMPHVYPPKLQKRPMRFKFLHRVKVFGSKAKKATSNAKDDIEGQSDSWADKWEETEHPFVTLEGNRAACAICLMDYEEPKRKSGAGGEDETDDVKAPTDIEEGTSGASAAEPVAQEAHLSDLKLSDAGQGSQPLRLLGCGHVFHVSPLQRFIYFGRSRLLIFLWTENLYRSVAHRRLWAVPSLPKACRSYETPRIPNNCLN